jgi:hypothetical protein
MLLLRSIAGFQGGFFRMLAACVDQPLTACQAECACRCYPFCHQHGLVLSGQDKITRFLINLIVCIICAVFGLVCNNFQETLRGRASHQSGPTGCTASFAAVFQSKGPGLTKQRPFAALHVCFSSCQIIHLNNWKAARKHLLTAALHCRRAGVAGCRRLR